MELVGEIYRTEDGSEGYAFGPQEVIRSHVIESFARKVLIGQNAFDREKIWHDLAHWQRGSASQLTDRALALIEQPLSRLIRPGDRVRVTSDGQNTRVSR